MNIYLEKRRARLPYRILSAFIAFTFIFSVITPPQSYAQIAPASVLNLPPVGTMVPVTPGFTPPMIKGITIKPDNPMAFDFIVGRGDEDLRGPEFEKESRKLIKYFLAALTVPEDQMWVNLSPYEKDRIVPAGFGDTLMGRDLLAQDYLLKQLTASLMYPEQELGKKFWDRVYKKAYEKYGTTQIPMNTFNKIWIMPEKAAVYEHGESVFVVESHLKVMLEEDYVALQNNLGVKKYGLDSLNQTDAAILSGVSSEIVREVLIPEIEREVNEGKTFARLRQIYNSTILASWYKDNLKASLLGQIYVDKTKTKGVDTQDKKINQKIYDQYVQAFKKGVYNYIREDYDPQSKELIPRKYFSGGIDVASSNLSLNHVKTLKTIPSAQLKKLGKSSSAIVSAVIATIPEGEDLQKVEGVVQAALVSSGIIDEVLSPEIDKIARIVDEKLETGAYTSIEFTVEEKALLRLSRDLSLHYPRVGKVEKEYEHLLDTIKRAIYKISRATGRPTFKNLEKAADENYLRIGAVILVEFEDFRELLRLVDIAEINETLIRGMDLTDDVWVNIQRRTIKRVTIVPREEGKVSSAIIGSANEKQREGLEEETKKYLNQAGKEKRIFDPKADLESQVAQYSNNANKSPKGRLPDVLIIGQKRMLVTRLEKAEKFHNSQTALVTPAEIYEMLLDVEQSKLDSTYAAYVVATTGKSEKKSKKDLTYAERIKAEADEIHKNLKQIPYSIVYDESDQPYLAVTETAINEGERTWLVVNVTTDNMEPQRFYRTLSFIEGYMKFGHLQEGSYAAKIIMDYVRARYADGKRPDAFMVQEAHSKIDFIEEMILNTWRSAASSAVTAEDSDLTGPEIEYSNKIREGKVSALSPATNSNALRIVTDTILRVYDKQEVNRSPAEAALLNVSIRGGDYYLYSDGRNVYLSTRPVTGVRLGEIFIIKDHSLNPVVKRSTVSSAVSEFQAAHVEKIRTGENPVVSNFLDAMRVRKIVNEAIIDILERNKSTWSPEEAELIALDLTPHPVGLWGSLLNNISIRVNLTDKKLHKPETEGVYYSSKSEGERIVHALASLYSDPLRKIIHVDNTKKVTITPASSSAMTQDEAAAIEAIKNSATISNPEDAKSAWKLYDESLPFLSEPVKEKMRAWGGLLQTKVGFENKKRDVGIRLRAFPDGEISVEGVYYTTEQGRNVIYLYRPLTEDPEVIKISENLYHPESKVLQTSSALTEKAADKKTLAIIASLYGLRKHERDDTKIIPFVKRRNLKMSLEMKFKITIKEDALKKPDITIGDVKTMVRHAAASLTMTQDEAAYAEKIRRGEAKAVSDFNDMKDTWRVVLRTYGKIDRAAPIDRSAQQQKLIDLIGITPDGFVSKSEKRDVILEHPLGDQFVNREVYSTSEEGKTTVYLHFDSGEILIIPEDPSNATVKASSALQEAKEIVIEAGKGLTEINANEIEMGQPIHIDGKNLEKIDARLKERGIKISVDIRKGTTVQKIIIDVAHQLDIQTTSSSVSLTDRGKFIEEILRAGYPGKAGIGDGEKGTYPDQIKSLTEIKEFFPEEKFDAILKELGPEQTEKLNVLLEKEGIFSKLSDIMVTMASLKISNKNVIQPSSSYRRNFKASDVAMEGLARNLEVRFSIDIENYDVMDKIETVSDAVDLVYDNTEKKHASSAVAKQVEGGINLNRAGIDFQVLRDGNGIPLPVSQQPIGDIKIDGVIPFIIQIVPAHLPTLLGFADDEKPFDAAAQPADASKPGVVNTPGELSLLPPRWDFADKYRNKFFREPEDPESVLN